MVGKDDLGAKPDEPKPVSSQKPIIIQSEEGKTKKPLIIEPDVVKPSGAKPAEEGKMKKPLIIEPDEPKQVQIKSAMPELKGEAGRKTARVQKPKKAVAQGQSRAVRVMLFLSLIFLAVGLVFLAFPIFNKPLPGWLEPVMDLCRTVPFPE